MGRWLALAAAAAAWPLRGDTRRRRLEDEYDAYVREHGDDLAPKAGYYGLRRVADMGYLEAARRRSLRSVHDRARVLAGQPGGAQRAPPRVERPAG